MKLIIFIALLTYVEVYANLLSLRRMVTRGNRELDLANNRIMSLINGLDNVIACPIIEWQITFFHNAINYHLTTLFPMLNSEAALSSFAANIRNDLPVRIGGIFDTEVTDPVIAQNLRTQFFDAAKALIEVTKNHAESNILAATPMGQDLIESMVKQAVDTSTENARYLERVLISAMNQQ